MITPEASLFLFGEKDFAVKHSREMGGIMRVCFDGEPIKVRKKGDNTEVTDVDEAIGRITDKAYSARGWAVAVEDGGNVKNYGKRDAVYVDPVDATGDMIDGQQRAPRRSLAANSLGLARAGRFVMGVVNFPLLETPRIYSGMLGEAECRESDGQARELQIGERSLLGAVLVSHKPNDYAERLERAGFTPVGVRGAVFKFMAVMDNNLLHNHLPDLIDPDMPIVGAVSENAWAHDYAGPAGIAPEGMVVTGYDGGELSLAYGQNGSIFASGKATHGRILSAIHG